MTRLLIAAVLGGVVLKGLIGAVEPKFVFFPYKGEDANPSSVGIRYESVQIETADGERLIAWQLEPERPPLADGVDFHGNGGNLSVWLPILAGLHRLDLRVLAVDYRGYGLSSGTPSEEGLYRDAEAVVRYAAAQRRPGRERPLVYWGRSIGGPVAAAATRAVVPDGVVLESTFPDKAAVVRTQPVLRVLNIFASYRFPTVELLEGFPNPVLVMHGDRDRIVPYALGRELFEQLDAPKRFVTISGADHNDLFDPSREPYWTPVLEFIAGLREE